MFTKDKLLIIHFRQTFIPLMIAFMAISCNDEFMSSPADPDEGVELTVSLNLQSEGFSGDDSRASRAIVDGFVDENTIKDYWLIEYDQNGNRIGFPRYYEYNEEHKNIRIIVPTDPTHIFRGVILVNTHNKDLFDQENDMSMSEDRLKTMYNEIRQAKEVYTTLVGNDGKDAHYLPMSCVFDIPAPKNGEIPEFNCTLRRNVAKIIMRLKTKDVKINDVLWCNVPEKSYTAERLHSFRILDATSFEETYRNAMEPDVKVLDWDKEDITEDQNNLAAGTKYLELVYYLPRSCWGKAGNATLPKDKNRAAPDKATYYEIHATNTKINGSLRYRIYPGTDVLSDFNIIANCCYTVPVVLDASAIINDSRVEDMNRIRLAESNSYIINPGNPITYEIPISRINQFWSNDKVDTDAAANVLKDTDEWIAEVIWQDQATQMIQFSSAESDTGMSTYTGVGSTSFYIRPVNNVAGNVVIGVRRKPAAGTADPSPKNRLYLWSWHLWLTTYSPDEQSLAWEEGKYEYPVTGGKVHRYESSYWQTTFHNKYMMDRNLGASTSEPGTDNADLINTFGLYYQYGRHAPLPYPLLKNVYDVTGKAISDFTLINNINMVRKQYATSHAEAVKKPHTYFYCLSNKVPPLNYTIRRWISDAYTNPYERNVWDNPDWYSGTKSLFDPCPPGWEVPDYGVYEGFASYDVSYLNKTNHVKSYFKTNSVENNNTSSKNIAGNDASVKGYHLYLNPDDQSKGVAWFPLAGCKSSTAGTFYVGPGEDYNSGPEGMYWMSVPINSDYCNRMDMTRAGIQLTPSFDRGSRSAACAVRCIRQ
ncbi:MAG: DUF4906 domain-containing protein [Bacteroidales bacterium]|nr:DUF4906 domain-containing protein [Bacteroidales bacterium]